MRICMFLDYAYWLYDRHESIQADCIQPRYTGHVCTETMSIFYGQLSPISSGPCHASPVSVTPVARLSRAIQNSMRLP